VKTTVYLFKAIIATFAVDSLLVVPCILAASHGLNKGLWYGGAFAWMSLALGTIWCVAAALVFFVGGAVFKDKRDAELLGQN